jgi:hypothetical protein
MNMSSLGHRVGRKMSGGMSALLSSLDVSLRRRPIVGAVTLDGIACITAASRAVDVERAGVSVYVLNMDQPVRIMQLAERMIRLSGLEPKRDIRIDITAARPGASA